MRHLIDFGDLTGVEREPLYQRCSDTMDHPTDFIGTCRGRMMVSLFYKPSTRTNFSFQTAMLRVRGTVLDFAGSKSTSTTKGEALKDIIKMVSGYAGVAVIRSPKEGAVKAASLYSDVPIINAGDGGHMHPTQIIADLAIITHLRGRVGGLSVSPYGDLKNDRTVHSLIKALAKSEGIKFSLITPRELAVPEHIRAFMQEHGMRFIEATGLGAVVPQSDVLCVTRTQREHFVDPLEYRRRKGVYVLTRRKLDRVRKELLVMHPLPRMDEIAIDVDDDSWAVYFEQARCGTYAHMALLTDPTSQEREKPEPVEIDVKPVCSNLNCVIQTEHCLPPLARQDGGVDCCAYYDKELR